MNIIQQPISMDYGEYGEKAARLFRAGDRGLLIPKGFVLSYQDFEEFLEVNKLKELISDEVVNGPMLQKRILEGRFSDRVREKLQSELARLKMDTGCKSFVVRSSSNIEDGENNSMAGMFESYLMLTTTDEVEQAIRQCYSALYSDKILNYVYENLDNSHERRMGVLIQEYIEGDAFGVLFTTDPVSGQDDRIQTSIFEGDSAKISQLAPSTELFSVHKESGELTSLSASKVSFLVKPELCRELLTLAKSCEIIFGRSLDMEWTWRAGSLYLLQIRPITSLKKDLLKPEWKEPEQGGYEWFRLYPQPLKPLLQDIIASEIREQSKASYETLFRTDTHGECSLQQGYVYVRSIPIEDEGEKRKAYLSYLEELAGQRICIYHDLHLPKLQEYIIRLKELTNRKLTLHEMEQFLRLAMEYHDYCARYQWNMVQANEFLYRFEREFLGSFPNNVIV